MCAVSWKLAANVLLGGRLEPLMANNNRRAENTAPSEAAKGNQNSVRLLEAAHIVRSLNNSDNNNNNNNRSIQIIWWC